MEPLRERSSLANPYNDGLVIFLYDESNIDALMEAGTDVFDEGMPDEPDEGFVGLVREGMVVAFGLEQDDPPAIEVSVGPPLNEQELARGRWHQPQRAPLSLPSGTLCIESYNGLRLSEHHRSDDDEGAVIEVVPGDYVLTLYRLDWMTLQEAGLGEDLEEWGGPWHVVVLTPSAQAGPLDDPEPVLWFPVT